MKLLAIASCAAWVLVSAGCRSSESAKDAPKEVDASSARTSTVALSSSPVPTASASATPKPKRREAPKSLAALKTELEKTCPVKSTDSNIEQKAAVANAVSCLKRKMIQDLDKVLVPMKTSDPERFRSLMKEQAMWNRFIEPACDLEEERFWVDFDSGYREDGTHRGYPTLGCVQQAYTDRILYARSLASSDLRGLVQRVGAVQADGAKVKAAVADARLHAEGYLKTPASGPKEAWMLDPDWKRIVEDCDGVQHAVRGLALSTCKGWPQLAKELGGEAACVEKLELYYYRQAGSPVVSR